MATLGKILLDGTDIITRKTFDYPDRPTGERKAWDLSKFAEDQSKPARSTKYLTKFYEIDDLTRKRNALVKNGFKAIRKAKNNGRDK